MARHVDAIYGEFGDLGKGRHESIGQNRLYNLAATDAV